jgi:N-acetylneuraminic acid mutarotase
MKRLTFLTLFIVNSFALIASQNYFEFSALQILTPDSGSSGLNGAYAGIDDDVLIISGGSDFNDTTGVYSDRIFLLKKSEKTSYSWTKAAERIPFASAYGGAVPTPFGLLCFGGTNGDQCISESWFINYIPENGKIDIRPGPALPVPLSNFTFAKVDNNLFVAGGISEKNGPSGNFFFSLDMTEADAELWKWETLPAWEGQSRAFAVGVAQSDGETNCFYLFSELLTNVHVYNPFLKKWTVIACADSLVDGTAFPVGASTIVFINGEDGALTGFNTITKESYKIDQIPITGQVTSGVRWNNDYVFPAEKPGEGTELFKINIKEDIRHLKFWDIVVIVLYF